MKKRNRTIREEIEIKGHDEDFIPDVCFQPTGAKPGTIEKMLVFIDRLEKGEELFHPCDETVPGLKEQNEALQEFVKEATRAEKAEREAENERNRIANINKAISKLPGSVALVHPNVAKKRINPSTAHLRRQKDSLVHGGH